ncbi:flagellar protein FlgN [Pannonibacter sp. SL95]|uniref:flagellar protein FlgN n=1 Tax=Pannonibacter sp. SL95 TaxID=2995153 RepID=UPI002274285F|nr:flagellar protein FlgN [Pannonibacter sp. SL95]MCY1705715.1 flagellar protein FlgN [Pannonibacter sp. SL95]
MIEQAEAPSTLPFSIERPVSRQEAENFCNAVRRTMERLLEVVEQETELVREGQLRAAGELQGEKAVLIHHYTQGVLYAKEHSVALGNLAPAAVQGLRRQHAEFQPVLRINLAVLATAREVTNSIVSTVARAVGAKQRTTTYGPGGAAPVAARPAEGIAVNRSL